MTDPSIRDQLQEIFRQVFDDPEMVVTPSLTAADVEDWDSLAQINLVVAAEQRFGVTFLLSELSELKNVGEFEALIGRKLARAD